jgi:predicted CoA-binding protein
MENQTVSMVIGASEDPSRYAHKAVLSLRKHDIPVVAIGVREGKIGDVTIQVGKPLLNASIDTVTLYLSVDNQEDMIDYILSLQPRRIIFNPGAENSHFAELAKKKGIEPIEACTLVMLSTGQYQSH